MLKQKGKSTAQEHFAQGASILEHLRRQLLVYLDEKEQAVRVLAGGSTPRAEGGTQPPDVAQWNNQ